MLKSMPVAATLFALCLALVPAGAQEAPTEAFARMAQLLKDTRANLQDQDPSFNASALAYDGLIAAFERIAADTRPLTERSEADLERLKAATQLTSHAHETVRARVTVFMDEAVFYLYVRQIDPDFPQFVYVGVPGEPSNVYRETVVAYQNAYRWGYSPELKRAEEQLASHLQRIERELKLRQLRGKLAEATVNHAELAVIHAALQRAALAPICPTPRSSAELALSDKLSAEDRRADALALEYSARRLAEAAATVTRLRADLDALEKPSPLPEARGARARLAEALKSEGGR